MAARASAVQRRRRSERLLALVASVARHLPAVSAHADGSQAPRAARALATAPHLLLLDEADGRPQPRRDGRCDGAVAAAPAEGVTILMVEHIVWALSRSLAPGDRAERGERSPTGPGRSSHRPDRRGGLSRTGAGARGVLEVEAVEAALRPFLALSGVTLRSARARSSRSSARTGQGRRPSSAASRASWCARRPHRFGGAGLWAFCRTRSSSAARGRARGRRLFGG